MTQPKKQLDDLLRSVTNDTPSFERDELRAMLDQKASGYPAMGPLQTSTKEGRDRGFITKGIIIMSISAILLTTLLLFYSNRSNLSENKHVSLNSGTANVSTPSFLNETIDPSKTTTPEKSGKQPIHTDSVIKYLGFNPVDLSCITPIPIKDEDKNKIGILPGEKGEVIFYHAIKVGFPMAEKTKTYDNYTEEDAKPFIKLPFHPTYATDSKGNLLMNYKYSKDTNGERSFIDLGDHESEYNQMLNSTYIPMEAISIKGVSVDSAQNPWIITNHYHLRCGIMTYDTIMSWKKGTENRSALIKPLTEKLRGKDSLYKAQFGGEKGMRARFQFPDDYSRLTSFERTVIDSLNNISKGNYAKRKDMLDAQESYLWSLNEANIPDTMKLMIHELSIKIGYEGYVLAHQEQEQELANITSLIPIQIRENTGPKSDSKYDNGVVFWYEPSKELFKALPQLQQRLSAEACTQSADQKLQNVSVYPNPASMFLFINYTLTSPVKVNISIWDLSGKIVAQNISSHVGNSGENKESITLGDVQPGVYLVILTTDSGERSVQRLVITK